MTQPTQRDAQGRAPLANPGLAPPKVLTFDKWPSLREFFASGGYLGVEYLYLTAGEEPTAQEDPTGPWSPTGIAYFRVKGVPMTIYARGSVIKGAGAYGGIPKCFISKLAVEKTGLPSQLETKPAMNEVLKAANRQREAIGLTPTATVEKTAANNENTPAPKLPKLPSTK